MSPLPTVKLASLGEAGLRDRVDLTITKAGEHSRIGLLDKTRTTIVDMPECPHMSSSLAGWFKSFRSRLPTIEKGSVRLRVAPNGDRGLWLDFANRDIKCVLEEGTWLRRMMSEAFVEAGQRHKPVVEGNEGLKLSKTRARPWFETYIGEAETPTAIYSTIGGFSQPGFRANKLLIRTLREICDDLPKGPWLELFSGAGNLTLPMASWGFQMSAFEVEKSAVEGIQKSLEEAGLSNAVSVTRADVYSRKCLPDVSQYIGLLVDPPRSGMRNVVQMLNELDKSSRPEHIVYVSCYSPTLVQDAAGLNQMGYQLTRVEGVDQFPQTPHCEWVAHFQLL